MLNNFKVIKSTFILALIFLSICFSFASQVSARDPVYNARKNLSITWDVEEAQKPIIPRNEIKKIGINIDVFIETGPTFGEGMFEGYMGTDNILNLKISDKSPWCSAVLELTTVVVPIVRKTNVSNIIYLTVRDDAPAYGEGYISITAKSQDSGLIKGVEKTFTLVFVPAYDPRIKLDIPDYNTKTIDTSENVVFPIEVENVGNARTKVFFEVENTPSGWSAQVTNSVFLGETVGSKATAYLTLIPPRDAGYHIDKVNIKVKITPAFADNTTFVGYPLYASFIVQSRGFSSGGLEFYLIIFAIIAVVLVFLIWIFRKKQKEEKIV